MYSSYVYTLSLLAVYGCTRHVQALSPKRSVLWSCALSALIEKHCLQVKKHLEADIKYLHKVRGSGAYSLTELADKLLPEVPVQLRISACLQSAR